MANKRKSSKNSTQAHKQQNSKNQNITQYYNYLNLQEQAHKSLSKQ